MLMKLGCAGGSGAAWQRRAHAAHCGIRRERVRALFASDAVQGLDGLSSGSEALHLFCIHVCSALSHKYERAHICFSSTKE